MSQCPNVQKNWGQFFLLFSLFVYLIPNPLAMAQQTQASEKTDIKSASGHFVQTGKATYYGKKFLGKPTASGELYSPSKYTAAHRQLPFGTKVKVTNLKNGKSVEVRINDRGGFGKGIIIDLSEVAAKDLGLISLGVAPVRIEVIE